MNSEVGPVAKWLRSHRVRLGGGLRGNGDPIWTQKEMTAYLNSKGVRIGESAYRSYDSGYARPGHRTIATLANALGDWPAPEEAVGAASRDGDVAPTLKEIARQLERQANATEEIAATLRAFQGQAPVAVLLPPEAGREIGRVLGEAARPSPQDSRAGIVSETPADTRLDSGRGEA